MDQVINPYLQRLLIAIRENHGSITTTIKPPENPLQACNLDNMNCPLCNNTGVIWRKDEAGVVWSKDCECMKKRVSIRRIKESGLGDMLMMYTFETYTTPTQIYTQIKSKALEFCMNGAEGYMICGRSGSGKTHICSSICGKLIESGRNTKYMLWRTEAAELKALVNDPSYRDRLDALRDVDVLYIDDFWKGSISDADVNLAFTIINDRYNSKGKKTILSTELTIEQIVARDEAIGGRIAEICRGYIFKAPDKNFRLEGQA